MRIIVATDPAHDDITQYISDYVDKLIEYIGTIEDAEISLLRGPEVTPQKLHETITEKDPAVIIFHGHGEKDSIEGFNDVVLVSSETTPMELFENRVVHAIACWTAQELGQNMVDLGAKTFIGYTGKFEFYGLPSKPPAGELDHVADLFLEPATELSKKLCNGTPAATAVDECRDLYDNSIRKVYSSVDPYVVQNSFFLLSSLVKNRNSLVIIEAPSSTT